MQYQSLYTFYWLGTCLRFLQDANEGIDVHGHGGIIFNIEKFFEDLEELRLNVTVRLGHEKLDVMLSALKTKPEDAVLSEDDARELRRVIGRLRDTLDAEIKGIGAYTPTPKRLDLTRLLSDVPSLFAPSVYNKLPPIAQFDFEEAGKSIAFERPTAAAFHILRGTEDVLRFYYKGMVRSGRISSSMWGPIVIDLRKRTLTKRFEALNNHLDNIRVSFRNPTQHPEAIYDIHEVQDLWAVCVDVVNRMVKTMQNEGRL